MAADGPVRLLLQSVRNGQVRLMAKVVRTLPVEIRNEHVVPLGDESFMPPACQGCCACGSVFRPSVDQKPLLEAPVSSEASARRGEGWATSSIFAASDTRGAFLSRGDRPRAGGLCEAVRSVRLPESERVRHSLKSLARPYRFRSIEYSL